MNPGPKIICFRDFTKYACNVDGNKTFYTRGDDMTTIEHETLQRAFNARSERYSNPMQALYAFNKCLLESGLHLDTEYMGRARILLMNSNRATLPVVDEFYNIICVAIIDRGGDYYTGNLSNQIG